MKFPHSEAGTNRGRRFASSSEWSPTASAAAVAELLEKVRSEQVRSQYLMIIMGKLFLEGCCCCCCVCLDPEAKSDAGCSQGMIKAAATESVDRLSARWWPGGRSIGIGELSPPYGLRYCQIDTVTRRMEREKEMEEHILSVAMS